MKVLDLLSRQCGLYVVLLHSIIYGTRGWALKKSSLSLVHQLCPELARVAERCGAEALKVEQ